jgi:hypothetical protein
LAIGASLARLALLGHRSLGMVMLGIPIWEFNAGE